MEKISIKRGAYISASGGGVDVMMAIDAIIPNVESIMLRTNTKVYAGAKDVARMIQWALEEKDDNITANVVLAVFLEARRAGWLDIDSNGSLFLPLKHRTNADN